MKEQDLPSASGEPTQVSCAVPTSDRLLAAPPKFHTATDNQALKQQFLDSLASLSINALTLRQTVLALIKRRFKRSQLLRWAVVAGYSEGHVRNLINRILREAGFRQRRNGGGAKTPQEAIELRDYARNRYGVKARKFLLAAYRSSKNTVAIVSETPSEVKMSHFNTPSQINENLINEEHSDNHSMNK
jgi:hypothetical protein